MFDDGLAHAQEQFVFEFDAAFLGAEDFAFHLLQLRGDEPLAVGDGLLADVMRGHFVEVGPGDLDVVAEDGIEADLERADAGAFDFLLLQPGDPFLAFAGAAAEVVQIGVEALSDQTAFLHGEGRFIHDGPRDDFDESGQFV